MVGLIVHVTASPAVVGLVIVAENCCVPLALKFMLPGITLTDSGLLPLLPVPVPKKMPLMSPFGPLLSDMVTLTLPAMFHTA